MVEPAHPSITVKRQAELLEINRSSVYRKPTERIITDTELFVMSRIDEIHTDALSKFL